MKQPQDLLEASADLADELEIGEQQMDADSDPDLGHDGIFGCPEKALDLQVLLDPFEKQLDLPAGLVDLCDGAGRKMEVVGQKVIPGTGFGILEADAAQSDRAFAGLGAGQLNGLITGQTLGFVDAAPFGYSITGSRDEEQILGIGKEAWQITLRTACRVVSH